MIAVPRFVVAHRDIVLNGPEFLRLAVLFDGVLTLPLDQKRHTAESFAQMHRNLEAAAKAGVVTRIGTGLPEIALEFGKKGIAGAALRMPSAVDLHLSPTQFPEIVPTPFFDPLSHESLRSFAAKLSAIAPEPVVAYAGGIGLAPPSAAGGTDVLEVVLDQVAIPTEAVPWPDVVAFRDDAETELLLGRLRRWMAEVASKSATPKAIEDELRALLDEHQRHTARAFKVVRFAEYGGLVFAAHDVVMTLLGAPTIALSLPGLLGITAGRLAAAANESSDPGRAVAFLPRVSSLLGVTPP
jgi:hypothetical protein